MHELLSQVLRPLGALYGAVAGARRHLYEADWLDRRRLSRPVVSVGNLTVGGTGKTPVVAALARRYREAGYRVAILSRGYRRHGRGLTVVADRDGVRATVTEAGDEALELARAVPGATVVVHEDRYLAGRYVIDRGWADVLLLDDGFQHLGLVRQLDIVCVDATTPAGALRPLPAGRLREPASALAAADVVLLTRTHLGHDAVGLRRWVRDLNPHAPIFSVRQRSLGLVAARGSNGRSGRDAPPMAPVAEVAGSRVLALSGIGNPAAFEADLERLGAVVVGRLRFRDHHPYRASDLAQVRATAVACGADSVITTMKDLVRLEPLLPDGDVGRPISALAIQAELPDAGDLWSVLVDAVRASA